MGLKTSFHLKWILSLLAAASVVSGPASAAASWTAGSRVPAQIERASRTDRELASFYAPRAFQPLWSVHGRLRPGAFIALELLRTADLDGLDPAKYLQTGIERAVAEAARGEPRSVGRAELLLSRTFGQYVRDVRRPRDVGAVYTEPRLGPAQPPVRAVVQALASAPSLETYLRNISWMHPIYGQLRSRLAKLDADPGQSASGEALLLRANMDRASILPAHQDQYILVDTAAARLDYFDAGELRKTMRVIVGSADHPTPMMVGMIRYATLNPYWHVPPDLTRERIAPRVLSEGLKYFRGRGYEVVSEWSPSARVIDPSTIDWKAVAAGRIEIFVRQKPGPHNGMGKIKLRFPNDLGIYLHDTPAKQLFAQSQRNYSGGCVRLEDAPALGSLLLGRSSVPQTDKPEQTISLTHPIPLYITYLTLRPEADGKLVRRRDVYGRDRALLAAAQDHSSKSRMR